MTTAQRSDLTMMIAGEEEELLCKERIPDWLSIPESQRQAIKQLILDTVATSYRLVFAELGIIPFDFYPEKKDVN